MLSPWELSIIGYIVNYTSAAGITGNEHSTLTISS